ncbi:hypothetical protein TBLA_0B02490 [Henningerozyma blattae CBS 6284]|uniref:Exocyst complex component EXO84 n=1 Tax=Henningerozyma blattae (strain ATCC 34711 / CBS 6284 / DSM 70876 / NBRC 10599 / NRRL Y-10934 / UCD 77-7) TaxID=1071380 RepID=I2GY89_HENB6|nr:hypothetical protein TBLA_0B02490 [Tetrapisispora blattae CBS 6284]CCH59091.1 hypothetical protein TBLA_0B02490 [Tetrapisispora blattae CBS 6284]
MVDFSLKKAKPTSWKHSPKKKKRGSETKLSSVSPTAQSLNTTPSGSNSSLSLPKKNPRRTSPNPYNTANAQLPTIDPKQRNRVASQMQRRMSIHTSNFQPPILDYSMPLPSNNISSSRIPEGSSLGPDMGNNNNLNIPTRNRSRLTNAQGQNQMSKRSQIDSNNYGNEMNQNNEIPPRRNPNHQISTVLQPNMLKRKLMDKDFNAKQFVHNYLNDASAMEIDKFTSNLSDISMDVQTEIKMNLSRSYKEIMTVNNALNLASKELSNLRSNIDDLKKVIKEFKLMAEKRLEFQAQLEYLNGHSQSSGLLPAASIDDSNSPTPQRENTSLLILKELWNDELNEMFKKIEGSQKLINSIPFQTESTDHKNNNSNTSSSNLQINKKASSPTPPILSSNKIPKNLRHILLQSNDWTELNTTTLKPLKQSSIIILNDCLLIASKTKDTKIIRDSSITNSSTNQYELIADHCYHLRNVKAQLYHISANSTTTTHILFTFSSTSSSTTISSASNNNGSSSGVNSSAGSQPHSTLIASTIQVLYESRDSKQCLHLLEIIRNAKDDLREIYNLENEKNKKIQKSFNFLKNSSRQQQQQTPLRSMNRNSFHSPLVTSNSNENGGVSMNTGNFLLNLNESHHDSNGVNSNNATTLNAIATTNDITNQFFLQSITLSTNQSYYNNNSSSLYSNLAKINEKIEEFDLNFTRLKYFIAVENLLHIEETLIELTNYVNSKNIKVTDNDLILQNLVKLKIDQRHNAISNKLSQLITNTNDMDLLKSYVVSMINLNLKENALDLFLQNRSNMIQELILQIGSFDNPINYLIQIAIIRFQTLKKAILFYQEIFNTSDLKSKFSSILVNWCSNEIDLHFQLIEKQFLNEIMLSPSSIKQSRKQIDDLKTVGLDFVYKLDEFISKNSEITAA